MALYAIGDLHLHFASDLKAPGQLNSRLWQNHEQRFADICEALIKPDDTLLLVTADHGLIDVSHLYVTDHPELTETLLRPTSVEPRATVFYVKPDRLADFPALFKEAFPEGFALMTGEEFRLSGILGPGEPTPKLKDLTGDFVAVSLTGACLDYTPKESMLKGAHAGLTRLEMRVPLIAAKK